MIRWSALAAAVLTASSHAQSPSTWEQQQQQRVEDARAGIRGEWLRYANLIETIEVGYKCGVVDETSANTAVIRVQVAMKNSAIRAGLIGDPTLDIGRTTEAAVQAGLKKTTAGACAQLTPEWRGQVRSAVRALMP